MTERFRDSLEAALRARPGRHIPVEDARDAAVLIPIVGGSDRPSLIFTVRSDTLPSHKGQISFPGGSIDASDESHAAAALREAHEEIGLAPDRVTVLGELDSLPTYVSDYVVTPVVGWLSERPRLTPNPAEVAEVLEIHIDEFVEDIRSEPGVMAGGMTLPTEAWVWNDHVIWGVTARIVRVFLYRLAEAGLAEAPAETASPWPEISPSPR